MARAKGQMDLEAKAINVKLTPSEYQAILFLVTVKGFDSMSAVLRAGLGKMMEGTKHARQWDEQVERERRALRTRQRKVFADMPAKGVQSPIAGGDE